MKKESSALYLELLKREHGALADYICAQFEGSSALVRRLPVDKREQVEITLPQTSEGYPRILFTAHLDVKGERGNPVCNGDVIQGAGADDLAGAAVLLALALCAEELPHGEITLLFDEYEEDGCLGAISYFSQNKTPFDLVISVDGNAAAGTVFAPDYYAVGYQINFYGESARLYPRLRFTQAEGISTRVGRLRKLEKCSSCSLVFKTNIRTGQERFLRELERLIGVPLKDWDKHEECVYLTPYGKIGFYKRKEFGFISKEPCRPDVFKTLSSAFRQNGLPFTVQSTLQGATDATVAAQYGFPALVLSSGAQKAHTPLEYVTLSSLALNERLLTALISQKME